MPNSDKNIVITPNRSLSGQPQIAFTGFGNVPITLRVLDDSNGTLSFEGSAGQLFSINNNLTSGSIFSVNDVSGIPSIDVNANGTVSIAAFGGNVGIGKTNPSTKLDVTGTVTATAFSGPLTGNASTATTLQTGRTIGMTGDVTWTSASFNGSGNVTGTATIANDSVTYAKIQNVSTNARLLGRATPGAGDIEEITIGSGLSIIGTTLIASSAPNDGVLTLNVSGTGLSGSQTFSANQQMAATFTVTSNATSANTASTIVARDASGNFTAGTITAALSGNASTATELTNFNSTTDGNVGTDNAKSTVSYISGISLFSQSDGALYSHVYSSLWKHNIYGDYRTGQLAVRGKNNNTWTAWRTVLDSTNYTSYAPTLTGSGASGSWAISVTGSSASCTGNAATATALQTGRTIGMTGDVTWTSASFDGSGNVTGTATIANDSVTYAKIQNVSATSRLLGRATAGAGDIEEITIGSGLTLTGTTLSSSGGGGSTPNNATLTLNVSGTGLSGSQTFTADQSTNATFTVTSNATDANTGGTIVARDGSGNFSAGTVTLGALNSSSTTFNVLNAVNGNQAVYLMDNQSNVSNSHTKSLYVGSNNAGFSTIYLNSRVGSSLIASISTLTNATTTYSAGGISAGSYFDTNPFFILDSGTTIVNAFRAATNLTMGATTGTTTIRNTLALDSISGNATHDEQTILASQVFR